MLKIIVISSIFVFASYALATDNGGACQIACAAKYEIDNSSDSNFACTRGCRFSAINQFLSVVRTDDDSDQECENNCKKAYADFTLAEACNYGCNSQGQLSPLGQMLETQPNFGADPLTNPSTFFDSVSTFIQDFSSAISSRVGASSEGGMPFGIVRVVTSNNDASDKDSVPTRVFSVKLSNNNGPFMMNNQDGQMMMNHHMGPMMMNHHMGPMMMHQMFSPFDNEDIEGDIASEPEVEAVPIPIKSAASRCLSPMYHDLSGPKCRAYIPRFQYNRVTGECERFVFGGCPSVDNMFTSEEECISMCYQFKEKRPRIVDMQQKTSERWILTFALATFGICALLGAVSSACLYCCRRYRQRPAQSWIHQPFVGRKDGDAKIFLIAPQMSWNDDQTKAVMPPSYDQVLAATDSKPEEKPAM